MLSRVIFRHVICVSLLAFPMAALSTSEAADTVAPVAADNAAEAIETERDPFAFQPDSFDFPRWPTLPQQSRREVIPPPPPGPYMSSALSQYSVKGLSFGRDIDTVDSAMPVMRFDSNDMPMDMFSPDRPWPDNLRPKSSEKGWMNPNRWMPEGGYRYAPQSVLPPVSIQKGPDSGYQRAPAGPYRSSKNNYEPPMNMRMPSMGWSKSNRPQPVSNYENPPPRMSPKGTHAPSRMSNPYRNPYPQNTRP